MQKQAPSIGRILIAVGLHALVLRADPLPLDRLRRPDPAEARELPDHRLLPRGDPARARVRRADRRRLGRQGQGDQAGAARPARQRQGHDRGRDRDRARVRADLRRTRGRSCARRRCSARPTSSSPRAPSPASRRRRSRSGRRRTSPTPSRSRSSRSPRAARSGISRTEEATQIDEIFNALDEETRTSFQRWQPNAAIAIDGRGLDLNDSFGNLGPFLTDASEIIDLLGRQKEALKGLVRDTGTTFEALTARDQELAGAIVGSDNTFDGARLRGRGAGETFQILPTFQRESRLTLERLDRFQVNARPLVQDLIPVARDLSPTLRSVRELSPNLRNLFIDLDELERASQTGPAGACASSSAGSRPVLDEPRPVPRQPQPGDPLPRVPEGDRRPTSSSRPASALSGSPTSRSRRSGAAPRPAPARLPGRRRRWRSGPAACRPTAATATSSPGVLNGFTSAKNGIFPNFDCKNTDYATGGGTPPRRTPTRRRSAPASRSRGQRRASRPATLRSSSPPASSAATTRTPTTSRRPRPAPSATAASRSCSRIRRRDGRYGARHARTRKHEKSPRRSRGQLIPARAEDVAGGIRPGSRHIGGK